MAGLTDRKKSRLAAVHPATPVESEPQAPRPPASTPPGPASAAPEPRAERPKRVAASVKDAARRRGRVPKRAAKPAPLDMISFNCNLTRDARAKAKMYAASIDVALQDVVEAALIEYLEPRGYPIERRPDAPNLP